MDSRIHGTVNWDLQGSIMVSVFRIHHNFAIHEKIHTMRNQKTTVLKLYNIKYHKMVIAFCFSLSEPIAVKYALSCLHTLVFLAF